MIKKNFTYLFVVLMFINPDKASSEQVNYSEFFIFYTQYTIYLNILSIYYEIFYTNYPDVFHPVSKTIPYKSTYWVQLAQMLDNFYYHND